MAQSNGRWWEFYLVRYLLGTFTGSIIILVLLFKNEFIKVYNNKFIYFELGKGDFKISLLKFSEELIISPTFLQSTSFLIVLISLGFVFCYLASAPILVLHAFRFNINCKYFNKFSASSIYFDLISIGILLTYSFILFETIYLLIISVLLFYIYVILNISKNKNLDDIASKYMKLTKKRERIEISREKKQLSQNYNTVYLESYKHLREHGNTFLIIIFEILLAILLYQIKDLTTFTIVIVLWILPAAFIWQFGNFLESKLYND